MSEDKTISAVIGRHLPQYRRTNGPTEYSWVCSDRSCGISEEELSSAIAHTADALTAAGFGLVADTVVIHIPHDTEAHARSFNEGYETAVAQELAEDPSLAHDWLNEKLAETWDEGYNHGMSCGLGVNPYRSNR